MFWGLVFGFLYVLYVYDRAIDILEFLRKGYERIKGSDDLEENFGIKNSSRFQ